MPLLEWHSFPSPSMEPWLSSIKWCPIKAGGRKKTTKRHAYREGGGYVCHKNTFVAEKTGRTVPKKEAMKAIVHAMNSHMACEVYGEVGHSWNDCPETHEEASYINNGFRQ